MEEHEGFAGSYEAITSANAGVAASILKRITFITTNGDEDVDNVTLADGVIGDEKLFIIKAVGHVNDDLKITPVNFGTMTQITWAAPLAQNHGCVMVFDGTNWNVLVNNGGTIA